MSNILSNIPDVCPDCGLPLKERNGTYGKFWGCSGYPACRYIYKENKFKKAVSPEEMKEFKMPTAVPKDTASQIIVEKLGNIEALVKEAHKELSDQNSFLLKKINSLEQTIAQEVTGDQGEAPF